jgi:hypothetical protein
MEAARLYLKSIVLGSAVRDTPIRVEPMSVITPEGSLRNVDKEAAPRDPENDRVLELCDEDEVKVQATDKDRTIPSTFGDKAAQTAIPVIELDLLESPIVWVETEVEAWEELASDAAAKFGDVSIIGLILFGQNHLCE